MKKLPRCQPSPAQTSQDEMHRAHTAAAAFQAAQSGTVSGEDPVSTSERAPCHGSSSSTASFPSASGSSPLEICGVRRFPLH